MKRLLRFICWFFFILFWILAAFFTFFGIAIEFLFKMIGLPFGLLANWFGVKLFDFDDYCCNLNDEYMEGELGRPPAPS